MLLTRRLEEDTRSLSTVPKPYNNDWYSGIIEIKPIEIMVECRPEIHQRYMQLLSVYCPDDIIVQLFKQHCYLR